MRSLLVTCVVLAACGGGGSSPECSGLALAECRLAEACQPDLCEGCSCTPQYRGCLAAFADPPACPALGCPSPLCCGAQADCIETTSCAAPGSDFPCGSCNQDPGNCTDDAMCGATMICEPIACSCDGNKACVQGCIADRDCTEDQACDLATARCVARPCADDAGCPDNFRCIAGSCARTTCSDDLDCDGFCVEGSCFDGRGECRLPSA
jgi:hypothetical protein